MGAGKVFDKATIFDVAIFYIGQTQEKAGMDGCENLFSIRALKYLSARGFQIPR